jgi:two-component sensor histidine kinase/PAS domain-containing protein
MVGILDYLFSSAGFLPHGICLLWRPDLVALHAISDLVIALSYFSIPLAIVTFVRNRPDFDYSGVAVLFAAFIILCGTTHLASVGMLWFPYYGLDGMLKLVTALVSAATAVVLWPLIPRLLAVPSPAVLRRANVRLAEEVAERVAAEAALREAHAGLEARVQARTAELLRAELRVRLAAEAAGVGAWEFDAAAHSLDISPQAAAVLGADRSGTVPVPDALAACSEDDARRLSAALAAAAEAGDAFVETFRLRSAGAPKRSVEIRGRLIAAGDGAPPRLMGTVMDVTERTEAAERLSASLTEKEMLLREVHHRVKNNLQSLLSLVQMERRRTRDEALRGRLDAVRSRVHVMAGNGHHDVNLGRQLDALCTSLQDLDPDGGRIAVTVTADTVHADIDTAVVFGLIANEIVSNAFKHAFPGGRGGRIDVRLTTAPGTVALTVRDDGVGDPGGPGSLGKQLVVALAGQLGGTVSGDDAGPGTTVRVVFPAGRFLGAPVGGADRAA